MSQRRLEWKVGLFVFVCLTLVGVLLIRFSKNTTFFRNTYQIKLNTANVGGLRPRASVLLAGVQIGTVSLIKLDPSGTNVVITLNIYKGFTIRDDARFVIEQSGFLGDQFIAIYPDNNRGSPIKAGAEDLHVKEPFNLQEVARAAEGFIQRIDETASNLNDAITDVRGQLLNQKTLGSLARGIDTFQKAADDASKVVNNINALVVSNSATAGAAVSNLYNFSDRLNAMAITAQDIVNSNRTQINMTVSNLQASSAALTNLLNEANSGNGLLGLLLKNDQLATNITSLASNLNAYSAYMRSNSLWHTLFHAPPPTNAPPAKTKK